MNDSMDLKTLEKRAWKSFHQDRLWDIYLGLILWALAVFLGGGFDAIENDLWRLFAYTLIIGGSFLAFWAGKRFITVPRLGRVNFGPARERRKRHLVYALMGIFLLTVAMVLLTGFAAGSGYSIPAGLPIFLLAGLLVGSTIAIIAWFNDYPRGYYIAVIYALCFVLGEYINNFAIFWIGGLLVIAPGVYLFIRFLKEHPKPAAEGGNG